MNCENETQLLLVQVEAGEEGAEAALFELVYQDLRRHAGGLLRGRAGHTLQATGLVHEAWLRLAGTDLTLEGRRHLIRIAARAMRHVLLDHARRRSAGQRPDPARRVDLDPDLVSAPNRSMELLILDEALEALRAQDERLATVAELRLFGGLGHQEIADTLELSLRSVERAWHQARAALQASSDSR